MRTTPKPSQKRQIKIEDFLADYRGQQYQGWTQIEEN